MQPYVIVLASSTREGYVYAKRAGLQRGRFRVVHSAKQVRRLRHAEIHELETFARRPDRHAIKAALRYTRGVRKIVKMPPRQDPRGELTDRQLEVAYRYNTLRDTPALDLPAELAKEAELERVLDATPPEAPKDDDQESSDPTTESPATDQGDGLGEQLTVDGGQEPVRQEPARKRRSRCKVCNELVFSDDDPAHDAAKHEEQDSKVLGKPAPTPADLWGT